MALLPQDQHGCPYLLLAPMEGVGDRPFRQAVASIGGFDEAVTEFIRVPINGHVASLARAYDPLETAPIPLAAQVMGADPVLLAAMSVELARRGAPRIDLNCGCPSNTVTGKGAGSSLLKDPQLLFSCANTMVQAVDIPVTIKMRSGFEDTSLFRENLLAAQESGVRYITLHPRTKVEGYGPPAAWELIAAAKALLAIPVVGNGDILTVDDALRMLKETHCDGLMIGRGSLINPFIFLEIRAHFVGTTVSDQREARDAALAAYLENYRSRISGAAPERTKVNKMKQLLGFLFKSSPVLLERRQQMLTIAAASEEAFMAEALPLLFR